MSNARGVIRYLSFSSPLGWILLAASSEGICLLDFQGDAAPPDEKIRTLLGKFYPSFEAEPDTGSTLLSKAREAILSYLSKKGPLPDFPLDTGKGTAFQQKVWEALCRIPAGETRSYTEVARSIDRPGSARAVGQACGKNPVAILIPCHRVVSAGGKMGGYSGGLHIKETLLELEKKR